MGNVTLTLEHVELLCYVQQCEFKDWGFYGYAAYLL